MTTTPHPIVSEADLLLTRAAVLVQSKWRRRETYKSLDEGGSITHFPPYGIPEALAEAGSGVALIVAERQCVTYGLDVWWNDLLCVDGYDAAEELIKLTGIVPERLYGTLWEANLGLLTMASMLTSTQLNGLSNVVTSDARAAFEDCMLMALTYKRLQLLTTLCEDIHYATAYEATTPAGVRRRLSGIRALECVAAHHVLNDVLPLDMKQVLVAPVAAMLLPLELHL